MGRAKPTGAKASFDDVYDQPDPRGYMRTLAELEYQIPEHAHGPFARLIRQRRCTEGSAPFSVVDLCTSYGIIPTLLNHDVTLAGLYDRYQSPELATLTPDELAAADRTFYACHRRADAVRTVGIDVAANAVDYAERVGTVDVGVACNLEESDPGPALARELAGTGLVTVTGGIGYITATTFDRILQACPRDRPPWLAAFSLRWVDMEPIATVLDRYGLTLERLAGRTFRQRRFADQAERDYVLAELRRLGHDPEGVEDDGYHHTCLYVARPHHESETTPLDELLESG